MTPTLGAASPGALELDLLVVLACAGVISLLMGRLRIATIPGYLIAGVIIGPSVLGLVGTEGGVNELGHYALIVLMFAIGLHMDLRDFRQGLMQSIGVGTISTLLTGVLVTLAARLVGLAWAPSIVVGMALAMSSTAVVLRMLAARRELSTTSGRMSLGVLITQDMIVIVFLAIIPLLTDSESSPRASGDAATGAPVLMDALLGVGFAILVVVLLIVLGRIVLPKLLREAARRGGAEVMLVVTAATGLGAASVTASLGLSAELGAFIAGFLLSATPFRYQLSGQLIPLRDLLMAVFFTAVGLRVDLEMLEPVWWGVPIGIGALLALKFCTIGLSAWILGVTPSLSIRTGTTLAQSGEFSLVILTIGAAQGLVAPDTMGVVIAIVIGSLILTPGLIEYAGAMAHLGNAIPRAPWGRGAAQSPVAQRHRSDRDLVIVAGYGPVGRDCAERVRDRGTRVVVVDMNPHTVRMLQASGEMSVYGDISNPEVLEHAGIAHASAVVLTIPDHDAMYRALRTIRERAPRVTVAVRAATLASAALATDLGAEIVVTEELAAATALSKRVLRALELRDRPET